VVGGLGEVRCRGLARPPEEVWRRLERTGPYLRQVAARRLGRPVMAGALLMALGPGGGVDLHAVRTHPVTDPVAIADRFDGGRSLEREHPLTLQFLCSSQDGQFAVSQLVYPVSEPLDVELGASHMSVVGDAEHDRPAAGVGQAGELVREVLPRRLAMALTRQHGPVIGASSWLLLDIDPFGLDLVGRRQRPHDVAQLGADYGRPGEIVSHPGPTRYLDDFLEEVASLNPRTVKHFPFRWQRPRRLRRAVA
jgi:hypothetical protein